MWVKGSVEEFGLYGGIGMNFSEEGEGIVNRLVRSNVWQKGVVVVVLVDKVVCGV